MRCLFASCVLLALAMSASGLDILETKEETRPASGVIPFAESGKEQDAASVLWEARDEDIGVVLRAAWTDDGVFLNCDVSDPVQKNPYRERDLWRGDCVYFSLDLRGDTVGDALTRAGAFQADDAVFTAGIGVDGPELRVSQPGNADREGSSASAFIREFKRIEDRQLTRYSILVPWEEFSSGIGQSDSMGLAVNVAHKTQSGNDTKWGRIVTDKKGERQLNVLAFEPARKPYISIAPVRRRILSTQEKALVRVAVNQPVSGELSVVFGGNKRTHSFKKGRHRMDIEIPGKDVVFGQSELETRVAAGEETKTVRIGLASPQVVAGKLSERIRRLSDGADNKWVQLHLKSTELVVETYFRNLEFQPEKAADFTKVAEYILGKLPEESFDFDSQVRHGLPFVFAFVSVADHSLQAYMTQFPYGYDPGKTYPLTVYLHGAGSDYPMDGLQTYYDNSQQDTLFTWDEIDPDNVPAPQRGFVIAPWARGNSSYQGLGELDVFQALHETRKNFKIDPDRVYLTGFSMGSGGAWRIASMTPDLWAGVNLASGFWTSDLLDHRIDNVKGLPFVLQAGTEEPRFMEPCKEFYQRFQEAGLKSSLRIIQDMRHTYPHPLFCKNMEELMQYTRKTPSEFSFEAESSEHGGRNGIVMNVPYGDLHGERPRFTCKIEGNTVTINSANTESLRVDLGEGGLGLKGKVKVIWNGKTAHEDDAKSIFLGEPFRTQNYFEK